ncbi:MAG: hypothetical protein HWD84_09145 [Flavobacteriaceae bacterium]|nr:hypothetical protein [Flavobacteriaceae bacterium]
MSSKYLRYAVGEIVLVVIGILIALQINNWNEKRKGEAKTKAMLSQIIDELKLDVEVLQSVNKGYLQKDSLITVFKNSDFSQPLPSNLDSSEFHDLIRTYMPFEVHDRGFQLLMNHIDELDEDFAANLEQLVLIYQDAIPMVIQYMDGMLSILDKHKEYQYQNFEWFSKSNLFYVNSEEEYRYYMYDPIYKNYMTVYREMYINILINSRWTIDQSLKAIRQLDTKLEEETGLDEYLLEAPQELINSMAGTYHFEEKSSDLILENRNGQLYESTYEGDSFYGRAFDSQFIPGDLRYLGDSLFYHDVRSNLRLNADGSISLEDIFGSKITSIEKK